MKLRQTSPTDALDGGFQGCYGQKYMNSPQPPINIIFSEISIIFKIIENPETYLKRTIQQNVIFED